MESSYEVGKMTTFEVNEEALELRNEALRTEAAVLYGAKDMRLVCKSSVQTASLHTHLNIGKSKPSSTKSFRCAGTGAKYWTMWI